MAIFVTGDTHGDFSRFKQSIFYEQENLSKDDSLIVCGDFGGIWNNSLEEIAALDWLDSLPFTTLFVCGNHENFDILSSYKAEKWNGGLVHKIRPSVIHLMRGQVFTLEGRHFFTMGGARSHDISDGSFAYANSQADMIYFLLILPYFDQNLYHFLKEFLLKIALQIFPYSLLILLISLFYNILMLR